MKVKKAGKLAVINPKGRLKKGTYVIVFKNTVIKDSAGNPLVDKKVAAPSP
ncbi:Ig-like domain-containing protein [Nocardioides sp. B-3]|uniref:Ig-like domain-containing protein n=1 Tax=Nocardioides sp. B-3 TaxID=2895565 RepID=UPI002152B13A|nr:Ig-like domain-containing protein [Nocardioides sp. B-3]UUZ59731.1 Ig-like domain-containing protein [Nocardioides sp. B-3]